MLSFFLTDEPVTRLADVDATDRELWTRIFHALLAEGVHLPPSPYETMFVSTAHGDDAVDATLEALRRALASL